MALVAVLVSAGDWEPQGDDALIELRARDVATVRNPLVGQPSTSGTYGTDTANVAHPGPLGFVVLAPGARLFGEVWGILLSTAAVAAASLLAVAWLTFRHLGPRGGAAGAVLGSLAAFSAGAAGLVDPLSSNLGRLPLLAAAVGVWALLCGDLRVAPLTVAFWSFAAHQHLSVLPAAAPLAVAGVVAMGLAVWKTEPAQRRAALGWVAGAGAVGLVLWLPVLWQQVTGDPGNLAALARYSGDETREDLGLRSALSQVATALGPRPFLGRSSPSGWDLVAHRSTLGVAATFAVVGGVLAAGAWWRRGDRAFVAAVAVIGVLALGGVLTGTNIPDSPEQGRLNFFHWAFALSFFWLLVLGWLGARLAPVVLPKLTHGRAITAVVGAAVVVAAVAAVPLVIERDGDRLYQPFEAEVVRDVQRVLEASPELAAAPRPLLVAVSGDDRYIQVGDTIGVRLEVDGERVVFPPESAGFIHPDRLVDPCTIRSALVLDLVVDEPGRIGGTELATIDAAPGLDRGALDRLVDQATGQPMDFSDDLRQALDELPGDQGRLVGATMDFRLPDSPERVLLVRSNLDLLIDHPPASPDLDRDDLVALRDSLPGGRDAVVATEIGTHLLDRDELAAWDPSLVADC
ncbi:MAG: hypothetical protein KDA97_06310 [Acidimicrobiales bacterium]|nr:hypothetical protein [Acidimicrobiales bacterium]